MKTEISFVTEQREKREDFTFGPTFDKLHQGEHLELRVPAALAVQPCSICIAGRSGDPDVWVPVREVYGLIARQIATSAPRISYSTADATGAVQHHLVRQDRIVDLVAFESHPSESEPRVTVLAPDVSSTPADTPPSVVLPIVKVPRVIAKEIVRDAKTGVMSHILEKFEDNAVVRKKILRNPDKTMSGLVEEQLSSNGSNNHHASADAWNPQSTPTRTNQPRQHSR